MNKIFTTNFFVPDQHRYQLWRIMRITAFIVLAAIMQVSASSFAQKISLSEKKTPLAKIFIKISQQSGYDFMVTGSTLKDTKPVTIDVKNMEISEVLKAIFQDQPVTYTLDDKVVTVSRKETSLLERIVDRFQAIDVRGRVVNSDGGPLSGASIKVKGTGQTVTANANGEFSFSNVSENEILIISFIGFETKEVAVQSNLGNVVLSASLSKLDEVQVIAYGTTSRRLGTGNIGTVKADDIEKQPVNNPLQALQGRISGLQIIQTTGLPGSSMSVKIRGRNSISASTNPLYIIDGIPFTSVSANAIPGAQIIYNDPLNMINLENIQSIDVLKDADATAIYGSRAANGVILITTKRGKAGQTQVDAKINSGWGNITRYAKTLNTQQYLTLRNDALTNSQQSITLSNAADLLNYDPTAYQDWQTWFMGATAKQLDASLGLNGGNSQTTFVVGGNFHKESTVRFSDESYTKGNFNFNLNHSSLNKKLKVVVSAFYTLDQSYLKDDSQGSLLFISRAIPNYPVFNTNGSYNWLDGQRNYMSSFNAYKRNKGDALNVSSSVEFSISPTISSKVDFGFNRISSQQINAVPSTALDPTKTILASSQFGDRTIQSFSVEPQLIYKRNISHGTLLIISGGTLQQSNTVSKIINVSNYSSDLILENPGFGTPTVSGSDIRYKFVSLFGRLTYNWNDKYIFNGTYRKDGSSRFGPGKQFGDFGSLGGAWMFSNEKFVKDVVPWLSFGKLRGSYGYTGSDGIGDNRYLSLYSASTIYGSQNSINPSQVGIDNFQWELTKKAEVALELGVFKENLLINLARYSNLSGNQLIEFSLPTMTGFSFYTANLPAEVKNSGWELDINSTNFVRSNFSWSTSLNITLPKNKLVKFPGLETSSYANNFIEGQSLNVIQRFNFLGVDPSNGLTIVQDINNDGNYTQTSSYNNQKGDYVIAGKTDPNWYGGLSNTIKYKNLQLDFLFQYTSQQGYNLFSQQLSFGMNMNVWTNYLDYWKRPGDLVKIPKPFAASNASLNNFRNSSASITDASFLRLKNVNFSYTIPAKIIQRYGFKLVRFYAQAQNIWTITNFIGYDPESATNTTLVTPPLKMITVGLQCSL